MGESNGIDSLLGGWAMPKVYSEDMRQRVIAEVESVASRRAAAEEFAVNASTAIIWVKCFRAARLLGNSRPCLLHLYSRRIRSRAGNCPVVGHLLEQSAI